LTENSKNTIKCHKYARNVLETIGQPQKTPQKAVGDLEIAKKNSDFTGKPLSTTAQGTMTTNHHETTPFWMLFYI
jgi:hypothetical protein